MNSDGAFPDAKPRRVHEPQPGRLTGWLRLVVDTDEAIQEMLLSD